jgi:MFS family permease
MTFTKRFGVSCFDRQSQSFNYPYAMNTKFDPRFYVYAARALRDFADGFVTIILPAYLLALGFGVGEIGIIATAALLGSAAITLAIGYFGAHVDSRKLLIAACLLMAVTGLSLALTHSFFWLLLIAIFGTINPDVGNASIFVPLEHTLLSRLSSDETRTRSFSRYTFVGAIAAAVGSLAVSSPAILQSLGLNHIQALQLLFGFYAVLGLVCTALYSQTPPAQQDIGEKPKSGLGPSRNIVYRLAALFSLDAFAGGLIVQTFLFTWLYQRFGLSLAALGWYFFVEGMLEAASIPVAGWLGRRIGLIRTMAYTHIPSSLFLIAAALAPNVELAIAFMLGRAALSQMDVPTRASYVMAVVTPQERSAAASFTLVPRSLAKAFSPAIGGWLAANYSFIWPLILCGILKIIYDFSLLYAFQHVKPPEEK